MEPSGRPSWRVWACALLLCLLSSRAASAQTPSPWTGVIRDEAEPAAGATAGFSVVGQHGLSADGRFLVFESDQTLVAGDTNGTYDVFLRDRRTGALDRVSIATDGTEGNALSYAPTISANGRHVVFRSVASNLDPTDTNGVPDLYVRDLDTGVTSLVTVGPLGERLNCNCSTLPARLSGDGRFVLFAATFVPGSSQMLWLRDRDADQNGVFDEAGGVTTTGIEASAIDGDLVGDIYGVAISSDARYVAYYASAFDQQYAWIGNRLYLHDRLLGTSTRIDRPFPGAGEAIGRGTSPDFSDNGQLAYISTAPNLVPGDDDAFADVFVYDIATATNTRLQLTHVAAAFTDADGTAISADGRFVAFTGHEIDAAGTERYNVYAIDRELQASYDISVRTDGSRDDYAFGASMSADGRLIAFTGGRDSVHHPLVGVFGVFVATAVSISSTETDVPMTGGPVPVDIVVPADTFWKAWLVSRTDGGHVEYSTYSGTGPGTVNVEIPFNYWGESATYELWLGSEAVSFRQTVRPVVQFISPMWGPVSGGAPFQVYGSGFKDGATVTFDGAPATGVVVQGGGNMIQGFTPPHAATTARVVVANPDGVSSLEEWWFLYYDDTPPVVTATVTGAPGANGWYTSDVVVQWTIQETDSDLYDVPCASTIQNTDVTSRVVSCTASSGGGTTTEQVVISRDATPPSVAISQPQALTYVQGQAVAIAFTCSDATSGVASCSANQAGNLQTSTPGTFVFVATAVDHAGNVSQASVSYTVMPGKVDTSLSLVSSPNPSHPNQDVTLTATVSPLAPGTAVPTGVVELRVNGVLVGSAPLVNGIASRTLKAKKGTYSLTATYLGDANFNGSSGTLLHEVR